MPVNRGSASASRVSASRASATSAARAASARTTTWWVTRCCGNASLSRSYTRMAGISREWVSRLISVMCRPASGTTSASRARTETPRVARGCRAAGRSSAAQTRPPLSPFSPLSRLPPLSPLPPLPPLPPRRRRTGLPRSARRAALRSARFPRTVSSAGSAVRELAIATRTTTTVPVASEEKTTSEARYSVAVEATTANPETITARPEVAAASSTRACELSRPRSGPAPRAPASDGRACSRRRRRGRSSG